LCFKDIENDIYWIPKILLLVTTKVNNHSEEQLNTDEMAPNIYTLVMNRKERPQGISISSMINPIATQNVSVPPHEHGCLMDGPNKWFIVSTDVISFITIPN